MCVCMCVGVSLKAQMCFPGTCCDLFISGSSTKRGVPLPLAAVLPVFSPPLLHLPLLPIDETPPKQGAPAMIASRSLWGWHFGSKGPISAAAYPEKRIVMSDGHIRFAFHPPTPRRPFLFLARINF